MHSIGELADAVATYVGRAAEKLRGQESLAGAVTVFIRTNPFSESERPYQKTLTLPLPEHSADTRVLVKFAIKLLKLIYKPGFAYQKAGVMLSDIRPRGMAQTSLFAQNGNDLRSDRLMSLMDQVNERWGRGSMRVAAERADHPWQMKRGYMSPRYSTDWDGLPKVIAK